MPDDSRQALAAAEKGAALKNPVRFVTAASLFDGHDASINIMRRILQAQGAEVVHLGHNRSVDEIVKAAIEEDAHGIAVSSYQGGHVEFFKYMVDRLNKFRAGHIKVFGGGGGTIVPEEIRDLHDHGVARIYSPYDGQKLGLPGMIADMLTSADVDLAATPPPNLNALDAAHTGVVARLISCLESGTLPQSMAAEIAGRAAKIGAPVLGITGTGGAGKSSLTDEIIQRFRQDQPDLRIALIAIDPTRRRTGGALLGDRIRMNAIDSDRVYMRSIATRGAEGEIPPVTPRAIEVCKAAGFDLVIVETPGIGQGDAGIVPYVDLSLYVMTPEFGAASQLEKIDMLDFADLVAINKFDRKGGKDALRDVAKQVQRNREAFGKRPGGDAGLRHHCQPLQRRWRDGASISACWTGCATRAWPPPTANGRRRMSAIPPTTAPSFRLTGRATCRRYRRQCAATTRGPANRRRSRARVSNWAPPGPCWARKTARKPSTG